MTEEIRAPFWMDLTPSGGTLIIVYPGPHQEEIGEILIDKIGEPDTYGRMIDKPDNLWIGYQHQNLPEDIKDIAERMATENVLESIGVNLE